MLMKNILLLIIIGIVVGCKSNTEIPEPPEENARYKVTFSFKWNAQDFPNDYPSNAHYSKLIGWSHNPNNVFFQVGTIASEGIRLMAESGRTTPLDEEINTRIENNEGLSLVIGEGLGSGVGEIVVEIDVDNENPSVTLVTMLAPSPDWYAGVININLYEDGKFFKEKVVNGLVYDAGTDSGSTFTSANEVTTPQEAILLIINPPLGNGTSISPPIAEVTFIKL